MADRQYKTRRYRVFHRPTGALAEVSAMIFPGACATLNWRSEDCIGFDLGYKPVAPIKLFVSAKQPDLGE